MDERRPSSDFRLRLRLRLRLPLPPPVPVPRHPDTPK
jgi:hypothetical protein